jgi:hypothetical protein
MRLWLERDRDRLPPEWRWKVLHVQSGHERNGRRLSDLLTFVEQESGVPPGGARRSTRGSTASKRPPAPHPSLQGVERQE